MTLPESDQEIIRYLLHETSEEEISIMEERLLNDPAFFELIESVEDDLIMQYVRGDMEEALKPSFEKAYLGSPERRARIESARQFRAAVREVAASRRMHPQRLPFLAATRMQVAFAVLAAALGLSSWFLWKNVFSRAHLSSSGATAQMFVVLKPGRLRGGAGGEPSGTQISVPPGIREVAFQLTISDLPAYGTYQVVLGTPERPAVFTGSAAMRNHVLTSSVPADLLTTGDYTLELQGVVPSGGLQPIATYYFRSAR